MIGTRGANDLELLALERHVAVGRKAGEVERQPRIVRPASVQRRGNLRPRGVGLRPENRAPRVVHRLERRVFLLEPALKGDLRGCRVRAITKFVVNLPTDHRWMVRIVCGHGADDPLGVPAVTHVMRAIPAPMPEAGGATIGRHAVHARVKGHDPRGHRRRRRAQHDGETVSAQDFNRAIQPVKVKFPERWLEFDPCELREPHDVEACIAHQCGVRCPASLRPLLRVVVHADGEFGAHVRP